MRVATMSKVLLKPLDTKGMLWRKKTLGSHTAGERACSITTALPERRIPFAQQHEQENGVPAQRAS